MFLSCLWSHAGSGSQKKTRLQLGSKWTKRMQKEWSVSDGGEAIDMEVLGELARALS
jgi:hypothetical protein